MGLGFGLLLCRFWGVLLAEVRDGGELDGGGATEAAMDIIEKVDIYWKTALRGIDGERRSLVLIRRCL